MREITVKVYEFNELSEEAKEKARNWYRGNDDADYSGEEASIKAIAKALGCRADWEISLCGHSYVEFKVNYEDEVMELSGIRALKWVWNNIIEGTLKGKYYGKLFPCPKSEEHPTGVEHKFYHSKATQEWNCNLTGFYMDMNLWETYKWMENEVKEGREPDVADFVKELEGNLCRDWVAEMEGRNSDEYIDEELIANNYEFYEDGSVN